MRKNLKKSLIMSLMISLLAGAVYVPVLADEYENTEGYYLDDGAYIEPGYYTATFDEDYEEFDSESAAKASVPYTEDEEELYQRMIAMQADYPERKPWTNNDKYVWKNIYYPDGSSVPYGTYTGYGCVAFAMILSDAAFGDIPAYEITDINYDKIRVGDILRINRNLHSVIIIKKNDDGVVIAEGNYNSSIHWGRTLTKREVEAADYYVTRYTESYTCTFESNGGSEVPSVKVAKGKRLSEPDEPEKEGYIFTGWFKDQQLTKKWNFNSDTVKSDITLYAGWTVDEGRLINSLQLDKTSVVMSGGESVVINAVISPEGCNPTITWSTDSDCIRLTESADGRSATITAEKKGTANLTVTAYEKFDNVEVTKTASTIIMVKRSGKDLKATMIAGEQVDVSTTFFEGGCPSNDFEYSVSPAGYASVNKKGILTVNKAGNVVVTVKDRYDHEEYDHVTITILPKPVIKFEKPLTYIGQQISVYDVINLPEGSDYKFMGFSSAKDSIAEISPEGLITAKGPGNVKITAIIAQKGKNGAQKNLDIKANLSVKIPKFSKTSYTIMTGQKLPIGLTNVNAASGATFTSADTDSVAVEAQKNGKGVPTGKVIVTGIAANADNNPVQITANIDGQDYHCDIYVKAPVISKTKVKVKVGKTTTLSLKNTKLKKTDVEWHSADENIAKVEPGGVIRGISGGFTTIYTLTGGALNQCTVTVVP